MVEPGAVVAFPRNPFSTVELKNPSGHVVEEIAVVGDGDHRAGILLEMLFEPVDAFSVEVVGGLVEKKNVGLLEEQTA